MTQAETKNDISVFWYPRFILAVSLCFCFDQFLWMLLLAKNIKEGLLVFSAALGLALVKKYFIRRHLGLYVSHVQCMICDSTEGVWKTFRSLWPVTTVVVLAAFLNLFLKLSVLWMFIGFNLIILPEYKEIYRQAVEVYDDLGDVEARLDRRTNFAIAGAAAYFLFRFIQGFIAG